MTTLVIDSLPATAELPASLQFLKDRARIRHEAQQLDELDRRAAAVVWRVRTLKATAQADLQELWAYVEPDFPPEVEPDATEVILWARIPGHRSIGARYRWDADTQECYASAWAGHSWRVRWNGCHWLDFDDLGEALLAAELGPDEDDSDIPF